jgi:hypothetical protein
MLLASRYRPNQHLVGASVFPFYWFVLKVALLGMLVVHVIASAVLIASGRSPADVLASLVTLPVGPGVTVFGWVTLVFAVADRHIVRLPFVTDWKPESLPPVRKEPAGRSKLALACEIFFTTVFVLWWAALPNHPWLVFGPAFMLLELAPVFDILHLPILLTMVAGLVVQWVNLLRPDWLGFRAAARIAGGLVTLVVLAVLLNAGDLVVASDAAAGQDKVGKIVSIVNVSLDISLVVTAIVNTIDTVREVIRLVKAQSGTAASRA